MNPPLSNSPLSDLSPRGGSQSNPGFTKFSMPGICLSCVRPFSPTIRPMSPQKPSTGTEVIDKEVAENERGHHPMNMMGHQPMNMMWAVSMGRQYDHMVHMILETSSR